jgi:archaeal flagellar protein FlaJ
MKFNKKQFIGVIFALIAIPICAIFMNKIGKNVFYFVIVICSVAAILPFIMGLNMNQGVQKEKDSKFLEFIRDLVEGVKSGTPINRGIVNLQDRDYGKLSSHVKKLSNQISIGIPLGDALKIFAKETRSPVISRAVTLISEAQRAGGNIDNILESVSSSVSQSEELKKEQKSSVSSLVSQGYIIFIIFIVIMLVLQYSILPIASDFSTNSANVLESDEKYSDEAVESADDFSAPLLVLLIVQAFFAGLVIGKISEGKISSGIKHSFILLAITLIISTGAKVIL